MIKLVLKGWETHSIDSNKVFKIVQDKLKSNKIDFQVSVSTDVPTKIMTLVFNKNSENKYFWSSRTNKLVMTPGDKRIATLGRSFLETKRLTKSQYDAMIDALIGTMDNLKLKCDVSLEDKVWRKDLTTFSDNIFKPTTFAEEKV